MASRNGVPDRLSWRPARRSRGPATTLLCDRLVTVSGAVGPMAPDQGQEEFVDDGQDACGPQRPEVHEKVVPHQVERHGEHGCGDALKADHTESARASGRR